MSRTEELREVVAEALEVKPARVTPELAMGDIPEWDSIAHLRLFTALEEVFGVRFSMQEITQLTSFAAIAQAIEQRAKAA